MQYPIFDHNQNKAQSWNRNLLRDEVKEMEEPGVRNSEIDIKDESLQKKTEREAVINHVEETIEYRKSELRKHSVLDNFFSKGNPLLSMYERRVIDPLRILILTSLSYSAKRTSYEGYSFFSVIDFYSSIFDFIKDGTSLFSDKNLATHQIQESLHQLKEQIEFDGGIDEKATFIAGKIAHLEAGKSYAMVGGWLDIYQGHAMIYRFERQVDDTYNIYIYNAQEQAEKLQEAVKNPGLNRTRVVPYICFSGVAYQDIFFSDPNEDLNAVIFRNLIRLREKGKAQIGNPIDSIFDSFSHLRNYLATPERRSELFISTQRSGNCTVKTINCMLLDLIDDYGTYKKISLDMRFHAILSVYQFVKECPLSIDSEHEDRETELFVLREASANFIRILNTNFMKGEKVGITEEQYVQAISTIIEVQQDVNRMIEESQRTTESLPLRAEWDVDKEKTIACQRTEFSENFLSILQKNPIGSRDNFWSVQPVLRKDPTWQTLYTDLKSLYERVEELKKEGKIEDAIFQIESSMKHFGHLKHSDLSSVPSRLYHCDYISDWDLDLSSPDEVMEVCVDLYERIRRSSTDLEGVQLLLLNIQTFYDSAISLSNTSSLAAVQNTAMEFLALSYCLALVLDRQAKFNVLKNYGLSIEYFYDSARKDALFAIEDPNLLQQRESLEQFFRMHSKNPIMDR